MCVMASAVVCLYCAAEPAGAQQHTLLDQLAAAELRALQALDDAENLRRKLRQPPASAHDAGMEARVRALVDQMTLTEKARQLDIWRTADILSNGKINMTKAAETWKPLHAGVGVLHDVYAYPQLGNQMMALILNASRLKIPPLFGGEATHGLQMDDHTIFPSPISLAATWDTGLMERYGQVVGREARAAGTHVTWSPVLGLCREPRWGRCEEMMGARPAPPPTPPPPPHTHARTHAPPHTTHTCTRPRARAHTRTHAPHHTTPHHTRFLIPH